MGSFSFKSSGTTQAPDPAAAATRSPPIGIATPLALGSDSLLAMHVDLAAQLTDNLRNLVMTNWGERLGFYDYGANLRPLMVDLVALDDFDSKAVERIRVATQRWMPYVDLVDFLSSVNQSRGRAGSLTAIDLVITFGIPSLGVRDRRLQVTLYAI